MLHLVAALTAPRPAGAEKNEVRQNVRIGAVHVWVLKDNVLIWFGGSKVVSASAAWKKRQPRHRAVRQPHNRITVFITA